jgi:peptidoglycan/LPS O-acetylase OafA/YrhL
MDRTVATAIRRVLGGAAIGAAAGAFLRLVSPAPPVEDFPAGPVAVTATFVVGGALAGALVGLAAPFVKGRPWAARLLGGLLGFALMLVVTSQSRYYHSGDWVLLGACGLAGAASGVVAASLVSNTVRDIRKELDDEGTPRLP